MTLQCVESPVLDADSRLVLQSPWGVRYRESINQDVSLVLNETLALFIIQGQPESDLVIAVQGIITLEIEGALVGETLDQAGVLIPAQKSALKLFASKRRISALNRIYNADSNRNVLAELT